MGFFPSYTFSPPTRKRSIAARLMQSFSQSPSIRSLMDTPALRGTEQHEPSGKLMLHCLKGALAAPRSALRETSVYKWDTATEEAEMRWWLKTITGIWNTIIKRVKE